MTTRVTDLVAAYYRENPYHTTASLYRWFARTGVTSGTVDICYIHNGDTMVYRVDLCSDADIDIPAQPGCSPQLVLGQVDDVGDTTHVDKPTDTSVQAAPGESRAQDDPAEDDSLASSTSSGDADPRECAVGDANNAI